MVPSSVLKAEGIFQAHQGFLRTAQAIQLGIAPVTLYRMRDAGLIIPESRGLYRLASLDPVGNPDLVQVSLLIPKAVICLISALDFHGLTTQIPHKVYLALPQKTRKPQIGYPPIDVIRPGKQSFSAGIQEHTLDGILVRIYDREKSIADCFKFRNKVGFDVALEALKAYLRNPGVNIDLLLRYARIDRVEALLTNYLKALT